MNISDLKTNSKIFKMFEKCACICNKSDSLHKHGAIIAHGNKIISIGYNHGRNRLKSITNDHMCQVHAEMHSLHNLMRTHKKPTPKRYSMYIIRWSNGQFCNSKPCTECIKFLLNSNFNITRIFYTTGEDTYMAERLKDITQTHTSRGFKGIKGGTLVMF